MTRVTMDPFVVVSSPGMHEVAERVVALLAEKYKRVFPHHHIQMDSFSNGEVLPHIPVTVRRQHVFFFHPLQFPTPNDALLRMVLVNDALKRASVAGITIVAPYLPYLRQDRKHTPRVPISARVVADLIESNRAVERVITADMHADQVQGFFSLSVDNLLSMGLFVEHFKNTLGKQLSDTVIVAPDFGGAVRARRFAQKLGDLPVAIFEKRRPRANHAEIVSLVGESIEGKNVIICDDMIDTGGTIRGVVTALKEKGTREVYVCATHGIFSGGAEVKFSEAQFPVLCTNSIPRDTEYTTRHARWLTIISMDVLLADAIYQASRVGGSVSQFTH